MGNHFVPNSAKTGIPLFSEINRVIDDIFFCITKYILLDVERFFLIWPRLFLSSETQKHILKICKSYACTFFWLAAPPLRLHALTKLLMHEPKSCHQSRPTSSAAFAIERPTFPAFPAVASAELPALLILTFPAFAGARLILLLARSNWPRPFALPLHQV